MEHKRGAIPTIALGCLHAADSFVDFGSTWRQLKDGLCLPLVAGVHAVAGRANPMGLLALPSELLWSVLVQLAARDLAALACSAASLQHWACEDKLWSQLYDKVSEI